MNYPLSDELINIENTILSEYKNENKLSNIVKTEINSCPTEKELLQIKRDIKNSVAHNKDIYIDDVKLTYGKHSRYIAFVRKHPWDFAFAVFSIGTIIPFLIPGIVKDLYEYYTTSDYNFISYKIEERKSMVTE